MRGSQKVFVDENSRRWFGNLCNRCGRIKKMQDKLKQVPEKEIVKQICSWIFLHRGFVFIHDSVGIYDKRTRRFRTNTNPYRIRGVSDILGIWRRKFLAIEVKSKTGSVTPEQERFIAAVRQHGGIAFVARSIEDVERELAKADAVRGSSLT